MTFSPILLGAAPPLRSPGAAASGAPAVSSTLQPPQPAAPFAVASSVPRLGCRVGSALASTVLATLDYTAGLTVQASGLPAGLAVSAVQVGAQWQARISGTHSGPAGISRASLIYVSAAGVVLGGSVHDLVAVWSSAAFVVGLQLGLGGLVGRPVVATSIASVSLSAAGLVDVEAVVRSGLPSGVAASLAWSRASRTGALVIYGTPLQTEELTMVVDYLCMGVVIGTSRHPVAIGAGSDAMPAAPDPLPIDAPALAPIPAAGAAIVAGAASLPPPDPLLSSVLLGMDWDAQDWGSAGASVQADTSTVVPGAQGDGRRLSARERVVLVPADGADLIHGGAQPLTVELYARIGEDLSLWDEAHGLAAVVLPLAHGRDTGGAGAWMLGLVGYGVAGMPSRYVVPVAITSTGAGPVVATGPAIARGVRWLHLASLAEPGRAAVWVDGEAGGETVGASLSMLETASIVLGGSLSLGDVLLARTISTPWTRIAAVDRTSAVSVDMLRATAARRYTPGGAITGRLRTAPWPRY
jgi:hypothetical protein